MAGDPSPACRGTWVFFTDHPGGAISRLAPTAMDYKQDPTLPATAICMPDFGCGAGTGVLTFLPTMTGVRSTRQRRRHPGDRSRPPIHSIPAPSRSASSWRSGNSPAASPPLTSFCAYLDDVPYERSHIHHEASRALSNMRRAVCLRVPDDCSVRGGKMSSPAIGTAVLFQDDFSDKRSATRSRDWDYNRWHPADNPSFLGLTQMRQSLPIQENGMPRHAVCSRRSRPRNKGESNR